MGFLQSAFLFSLAALAIPVLLHLFSRWQSQRIELGTIRFLQEVLTENVHRRRIRRWLLMLTRMALLGVLALLFARPFFFEPTKRDGDRRRVILIDRSASMAMRGTQGKAIDVAIEKATAAARELGADAKIDWAWFDAKVHPFQPRDGRSVSSSSKDVSPTGHTNYAAAIAWARDRIAEDSRAKSDVVMITDLQRQGLGDPTEIHFPPDVPFQIVDVGREAASNLAISRIDLAIGQSKLNHEQEALRTNQASKSAASDRTPYDPSVQGFVRPDQTIYVHATLFNYGPMHRDDVPVVITARQGTKMAKVRTTINAKPEQATEFQIELGKLSVGAWEIVVEADVDDDMSLDNRRVHGIAVDNAPEVLLVGEPDTNGVAATGRFFVNKALREGLERDLPRFAIHAVSTADAPKKLTDEKRWRLIVLTDATNIDAQLMASLEHYVGQGGNILAFTGPAGGELGAAKWNNSPLAPGRLGALRNAGVVPFRLTPIDRGHLILQPFDDPQSGDLQRLTFRKAISLRLSSQAKLLASFDSDLPGIVEMAHQKGRAVWFLSDAGDGWSNWTSSPLYLPLVHQMVCDLAGLTGEGPIRFRSVGDMRTTQATNSSLDSQQVSLTHVKLKTDLLVDSFFEDNGFTREKNVLYVVNTPESESDTARIAEVDFRKAFALLAPEDESQTIITTDVKSIKKQELWPWLAGLMVMLLVFEFALSNRTPP